MRILGLLLGTCSLATVVGCGKGGADAAVGAGGSGSGAPPASGIVTVDGCAGSDGLADTCEWHYRYDPAVCGDAAPCRKLLAFYAGGEQMCAAQIYQDILAAYAAAGYLAACMQLFETSSAASEQEPYLDEAPRVDLVLADYVGSTVAASVWSGEHLLISGVSHGATAPVIAMARTDLDDGPHWSGTGTTGACFYDGIYDIEALDVFTGGGNGLCAIVHERIIERYYGRSNVDHACDNDRCACDPDHAPAMDEDTVVAADPAELAIASFKLVECGSGLLLCGMDLVPAEPIESLCTAIDDSPDHDCSYGSLPDDSHVECAGSQIGECLDWFEQLVD